MGAEMSKEDEIAAMKDEWPKAKRATCEVRGCPEVKACFYYCHQHHEAICGHRHSPREIAEAMSEVNKLNEETAPSTAQEKLDKIEEILRLEPNTLSEALEDMRRIWDILGGSADVSQAAHP